MKTVSRSIKTARSAWVLTFAIIFVILFSLGQGASAATINTYDNFWKGYIDTDKWMPGGTTNYLSVRPSILNSPSNYVLHAEGYGTANYDRARLVTKNTFSGYFGAGLTFFNFEHSGNFASGGTNPPPSITLAIGDWVGGVASNPYFLISRAVNPSGQDIIGWKEYSANGLSVLGKGGGSYMGTSGGLELNYKPDPDPDKTELQLGYFASTDTSTWSDLTPVTIMTFTGVHFNGDPRLLISFAPGGLAEGLDPSFTSVDVGGLYYATLVDSHPVPLPSGLLLLAPGLAGIAAIRRRFTK
ncbi:MAG: hypothetical protein NT010_13135 [Proteobacteria bacterium]|nr:hypothetical protein [Pseudomonadota bacterium]